MVQNGSQDSPQDLSKLGGGVFLAIKSARAQREAFMAWGMKRAPGKCLAFDALSCVLVHFKRFQEVLEITFSRTDVGPAPIEGV